MDDAELERLSARSLDEFYRDAAHAEIERLAEAHQGKKPLYADRKLSTRTPGTEHMGAPPDAQLTHEDVLAAVRELAEKHGVSCARVRGMCMLTAAAAGLGHSESEEAAVLSEVMLSLERGQDAVSGEQILELSGRSGADTSGPIPDEEHLQAAAVLSRSGHGGYPAAAVAQRARELGVPDPLAGKTVTASPDTMSLALSMAGADTGEAALVAGTTQETRAALQLAAGQDTAEKAIARHPELAHLFKKGRTSGRKHPRTGMLTTKTRAHSSDLDDDPAAEDPAAAIARYTKMREQEFGGESRDAGMPNRSYGPTPYKSPGRSGKPQSR